MPVTTVPQVAVAFDTSVRHLAPDGARTSFTSPERKMAIEGEEAGEHPAAVRGSVRPPVAELIEHAAALDDVLVVPLDGLDLAEPALRFTRLDLPGI